MYHLRIGLCLQSSFEFSTIQERIGRMMGESQGQRKERGDGEVDDDSQGQRKDKIDALPWKSDVHVSLKNSPLFVIFLLC